MLRKELPASPHNGGKSSLINVAGSGEAPWPPVSYSQSLLPGWNFQHTDVVRGSFGGDWSQCSSCLAANLLYSTLKNF